MRLLETMMQDLATAMEAEAQARYLLTDAELNLEKIEAEHALKKRETAGPKATETHIKELVASEDAIYWLKVDMSKKQLEYDQARNEVRLRWKNVEIAMQPHPEPHLTIKA